MAFTALEKYREIMREVVFRQKVYPRQVDAGKLSHDLAEKRIQILIEIANDLRKQMSPDTDLERSL